MERMSCGLSTAQLDKINVYTFTQDWKHHCSHRCSLMTYSFAEVANASDLEGSSGLRWVQFQVNWCPSFFGQGEALSQWSGHVKRLLALHLTTNHTENTGAVKTLKQNSSYLTKLSDLPATAVWQESKLNTDDQVSLVPLKCTLFIYLHVLGGCPRRVCLQTNQLQPFT